VGDTLRTLGIGFMGGTLTTAGDIAGGAEWFRRASEIAHRLEEEGLISLVDLILGFFTPDDAQAVSILQQTRQLAQQSGQKADEACALTYLGTRLGLRGEYEQATALLEESLRLAREAGDKVRIGEAHWRLGQLWLLRGDAARARALLEACAAAQHETLPTLRVINANFYIDLGTARLYQGDVDLVRQALRLRLPYAYRDDNMGRVAQGLALAAGLAQALGKLDKATRLLSAAATLRRDHHTHGPFERELFAEYDRRLPAVQAAMSQTEFERAWGEGQQLTVQEAIAEALAL
jgi:tetratricopeptide (TPR) repeat protein